jgi:NADH-quinone oxidoreductase subunit J
MAGVLARQLSGGEGSPLYGTLGGASAIDQGLADHGAVGVIARPLFTEYVVPFEITGILLLVAIIGALVLAKQRAS